MIRRLSGKSSRKSTKDKSSISPPPPLASTNSRGGTSITSPVTADTVDLKTREEASKQQAVYVPPRSFQEREQHELMADKLQAVARGNSARKLVAEKKASAQQAAADADRLAAKVVEDALEAERKAQEEKLAAERREAEEKRAAERKAQQELAEANARKLKELQAAHEEKMVAIARAKERARTAEDEREARAAKLLEDELETRLTADLTDLASREQAARDAVSKTDAEKAAVSGELFTARLKLTEIAELQEKKKSLTQVIELMEAYSSRCASCRLPVTSAEDAATLVRADEKSVAARAEIELKESKARLSKQAELKATLQAQLNAAVAECSKAEDQALESLKLASSEATTQQLKLTLAERAVALCAEETARHNAAIADAKVLLAVQRERAETTSTVLGEMAEKSSLDKKNVAELEEKIVRVEADDKHAAAVAVLVDSAFEVDIKAASLLAGVQKGLLAGEVPVQPATPHARSVILEQEAFAEAFQLSEEAKGGQPSRKKLMEKTYDLVRAQLERTNACSEDVAVRRAQFSADCAAAHNQRQNELLVLRAVKAAIELGMVERAAFAEKKQSQYEIEQEEVRASVATIHAHEECLKMLAAEAQAAATTRKEVLAASKAADAAKASATDALSALRQKSKERLTSLRATLASETEICNTQMAYAENLMSQLTQMAIVKAGNPFSPTFKWSTWKGGNSASPEGASPGKAADSLLNDDATANTAWLTQLKNDEVAASEQIEELQKALDAAEKVASFQLARLSEQRAKYATALSEVSTYAAGLEAKSPRAAASSPRLRAKGSQNRESADVSKTPSSPATELPVRNLENELDAPVGSTMDAENFDFAAGDFKATSPKVSPTTARREKAVTDAQFDYLKKKESSVPVSPHPERAFDHDAGDEAMRT